MQELEALQKELESFKNLSKILADLETLAALEDLKAEDLQELKKEYTKAEKEISAWESKTLLGGKYDSNSALLTIRSGAGGVDAQDWAEMLLRMYLCYAEQQGFKTRLLDESRGEEAGIKSATIEITAAYAYGYLRGEAGVHRLVRISPFNAKSLRQTSFASVEVMPVIEEGIEEIEIKPDELRIDTYRSSSAGGQNVNKTESAVRVTHIPTGLVAACQSERSQLKNKELAMRVLRSKIATKLLSEQEAEKRKIRGELKSAEWGNQIRSYVLHPYTLVKDHRTNTETSNVNKVLEGDLQIFIESELRDLPPHQ
jgi:peptide chain release factor 2